MKKKPWQRTREDYKCCDCREDIPYVFMVHDELWAQVGYEDDGFACIPCLEKRMGRGLAPEDLKDVPCNFMIFSKKPTVWGLKEGEEWKWVRVRPGLEGYLDFHHRRNLEYVAFEEYRKA
jgi:hypothetical protein